MHSVGTARKYCLPTTPSPSAVVQRKRHRLRPLRTQSQAARPPARPPVCCQAGRASAAHLQAVPQVLQQVLQSVEEAHPPAQRLGAQRGGVDVRQPPGARLPAQAGAPPGALDEPARRSSRAQL